MALFNLKNNKKMPDIEINKKVPLLILDQRWHQLFPEERKTKKMIELEERLNKLVQKQGQINTEFKEYTKLKKKMMSDIMENMSEAIDHKDKNASKLLENNKQYILGINDKLKNYEEQLDTLPQEIQKVNQELLKVSVNICYHEMKKNDEEIKVLEDWINETKEALKDNLILKQEKEAYNNKIYAYMHDLLGYEVVNIFDKNYGE